MYSEFRQASDLLLGAGEAALFLLQAHMNTHSAITA